MSTYVNRNYVSKEYLYEITKSYLEKVKENPKAKIPDDIGNAIILMVDKILSKFSYRGYTYREEMRSEAILACVLAVPKFDPTRSENVYGFLTTTIHWKIHGIIKKEKDLNNKQYEYLVERASEMYDGEIDPNRLSEIVMAYLPDNYTKSESGDTSYSSECGGD
jgi:DNA-directed RNA polymerase specialized sigma subunit